MVSQLNEELNRLRKQQAKFIPTKKGWFYKRAEHIKTGNVHKSLKTRFEQHDKNKRNVSHL